MNLESSRTSCSLTVGGTARRIDSSFARTPSTTATVFSPIARRMSSCTAGLSPSHTDEVGRSKLTETADKQISRQIAISVSVRRLIASDDTISDITGSASGSTFVMTGGRSSGGTLLIAPATFSRTSLTASFRSRSSTKRTVMLAPPSLIRAEISSMPDTPLIASSIGSTTDEETSSGLAPGSDRRTLTVAGSAFGKRSTPRSRNEKIPSTTSDITSIVAKTGRLTQSSDNILVFSSHVRVLSFDFRPVAQPLDVRGRDHLARIDAAQHLDPVAEALADFHFLRGRRAAVDHEHAVDAVAVLQRRVRHGQHLIDLAAVDAHAREGAGLENRLRVGHEGLEGKRARRRVDGGSDTRQLARERLVGIRVDAQLHRLAGLNPRHHLLGDFGGHLQRIDAHQRHHRHRRAAALDELTEIDEALLDLAVERRADIGIAQLAVGKARRGIGRRDVRLKILRILQRQLVARLLRLQHRVRIVERLLRHELTLVQLVGAVVGLLRLHELRLRLLDVGRPIHRREMLGIRRAVLRECARQRRLLLREVVLRFFTIELDERVARMHAIAQVVKNLADDAVGFRRNRHFVARGGRV